MTRPNKDQLFILTRNLNLLMYDKRTTRISHFPSLFENQIIEYDDDDDAFSTNLSFPATLPLEIILNVLRHLFRIYLTDRMFGMANLLASQVCRSLTIQLFHTYFSAYDYNSENQYRVISMSKIISRCLQFMLFLHDEYLTEYLPDFIQTTVLPADEFYSSSLSPPGLCGYKAFLPELLVRVPTGHLLQPHTIIRTNEPMTPPLYCSPRLDTASTQNNVLENLEVWGHTTAFTAGSLFFGDIALIRAETSYNNEPFFSVTAFYRPVIVLCCSFPYRALKDIHMVGQDETWRSFAGLLQIVYGPSTALYLSTEEDDFTFLRIQPL